MFAPGSWQHSVEERLSSYDTMDIESRLTDIEDADLISRMSTAESFILALQSGKQDKFSGTTAQYVRGDGTLAAFPSIPAAQIQSDWAQTNSGAADFIKNKPVKSYSTPSRSLNSAFQISTTKEAQVSYSVPITTVAAILAGARGRVTLQYADNSGMTTNLVNVQSSDFGTASGLVVTSYGNLKVSGIIPAGKYVRLVTENVIGSPTYGTVSAQEVLL